MTYSVLLIVLPLLLAFLSMFVKKGKENVLYFGVLLNVLLLFVIEKEIYLIGGFDKSYGITLFLDQYSYIAVILVNVLFLFSIISNHKQIKSYSTVLLTLLAGVNGMLLTGDLFNLFVFLEITTISAYILTTSSKKYVSTFNYIIIGSIGSGIYLLGVIMLYAGFGTLNLEAIASQVASSEMNLMLPLLLIFVGLSVETKLLPFNGWVKGIYKNANGLVGSLMASIVASATLFVMGRVLNSLVIGTDVIANLVMIVAVVTLIAGELSAFKSKSIKEILLYSSIGQSGLITLLMISGLIFPAVLMIINNGISKLIMFSIGHTLSKDDQDYQDIKGVFAKNQLMGLAFTISSFSLIGLPLFLGFYAKINSLIGLFENDMLLAAVILLITIVEGAYLIRLNIALWHPGEEGELVTETELTTKTESSSQLVIATLILSAVIILVGFMPNLLGDKLLDDQLLNDTEIEYLTDLKGGM